MELALLREFGFPIFVALCCGAWVAYLTKTNRTDVKTLTESHREDIANLTNVFSDLNSEIQKNYKQDVREISIMFEKRLDKVMSDNQKERAESRQQFQYSLDNLRQSIHMLMEARSDFKGKISHESVSTATVFEVEDQ